MKKNSFLIIVFLALSFAISACHKNTRTIYVYTWADYLSPDIVKQFEKLNNCKIVLDYFDSNEAMYAKLKIAGAHYDLVLPSSYMASIMKKENMILNLDQKKIPNLKYVDLKYIKKTEDPNTTYSVPYAISFTILGYDKKRIPEPPYSWAAFGDKKYFHQITMLNDMRESMGTALKHLGYSINSTNDKELLQAKELMLKWKENIAAYQTDEAKTSLAYNILSVIQAYNGDIIQMEEDNPDIQFTIPKEGTSIGIDVLVIPSKAKNADLAYKFINFLYEPENSAQNMKYISYLCPNKEALSMLDKNFREKIEIPEADYERSEVIKDLGKDNPKYTKIWDEILAY